MSMKNSNVTIGNRNRDLSACSEVSRSTAPSRAPGLKAQSDEMRKRTGCDRNNSHILRVNKNETRYTKISFIYKKHI